MKTQTNYKATFTGRKVGAIGITHRHETIVSGENEEKATLNLYDRFEHISDLQLKETLETNWNHIDLSRESYLNLIDGLTFDDLLLEISHNLPVINAETVREQFLNDLSNRVAEAKKIFEANLGNIIKHSKNVKS